MVNYKIKDTENDSVEAYLYQCTVGGSIDLYIEKGEEVYLIASLSPDGRLKLYHELSDNSLGIRTDEHGFIEIKYAL